MPFYVNDDVRIHYEEAGSGFPILVTPGGGLNSLVSNWSAAVFSAMEEFRSDFRCVTMDQRNANGGESSGPIAVDDPWGAFAADQLGLMDHLGIREFFFMGYCIGGPFALNSWNGRPSAWWPACSASRLGTDRKTRTSCTTLDAISGHPSCAHGGLT